MKIYTPSEAISLLERVLNDTCSGLIPWAEDPSRPGSFDFLTDDISFTIQDRERDGSAPYEFCVWTAQSTAPVETIETSQRPDAEQGQLNALLSDLYSATLNQVRGLNDVQRRVDQVLGYLEARE